MSSGAARGCRPGAILHAGVSRMSMSPGRAHVFGWEAMLAVDAPEDHSLQGVSLAPGPAPKLPGWATGMARAPVRGLTMLPSVNLHGTCDFGFLLHTFIIGLGMLTQ